MYGFKGESIVQINISSLIDITVKGEREQELVNGIHNQGRPYLDNFLEQLCFLRRDTT